LIKYLRSKFSYMQQGNFLPSYILKVQMYFWNQIVMCGDWWWNYSTPSET
jgi:hypothetical protein